MPALDELLHGSTIAINTVLERKGARTALITTRGFRDTYAIGRGNRIEAFNLFFHRPKPLIPRDLTFEVSERMNAAGEVLMPLDEAEVQALVEVVGRAEASRRWRCASCTPMPTRRTNGASAKSCAPPTRICSSRCRTRSCANTANTSAPRPPRSTPSSVRACRPICGRLESFLRDGKVRRQDQHHALERRRDVDRLAQEQPVSMMESGPVAGMIGAGRLAALLGIERAIGFDMGGTTAKASLITSGMPAIEDGYVIGDEVSGQPMQIPVVDIVEIGAGGGSIAWCDPIGGSMSGRKARAPIRAPRPTARVRPIPVVTDADLRARPPQRRALSQRRDEARCAAAERAIAVEALRADALRVTEAALGIVQIADAAMSLAVRAVSVKKGVDPRDTAMIAFGGAGPLHAVAIAREIFIPKVIIPKVPGTFSALGMLMASWRQDFVRTLYGDARLARCGAGRGRVRRARRRRQGPARARRHRRPEPPISPSRRPALRRPGAHHRDSGARSGAAQSGDFAPLREAFDAEHDQRYGQAAPDERLEIVNVRLVVTAARPGHAGGALAVRDMDAGSRRSPTSGARSSSTMPAKPVRTRIVWRPSLPAGAKVEGPAVIEEPNATTFIHPGDVAIMSDAGHLIIDVKL